LRSFLNPEGAPGWRHRRCGRSPDLLDYPGVRLNQVTVGSVDLARSERFYVALGLRLIVQSDHYLRFECPDGDSTFSLERVEGVAENAQVTIYFETDDLGADFERLTGAGIAFDLPPQDMPWLWLEARLRDPDGHRICLYHAGRNRKDPPWRLQ
jgi:catechol 2,3-dioxygenase-like lactoylglutathione lyase family enzyme